MSRSKFETRPRVSTGEADLRHGEDYGVQRGARDRGERPKTDNNRLDSIPTELGHPLPQGFDQFGRSDVQSMSQPDDVKQADIPFATFYRAPQGGGGSGLNR